MVFTAIRLYYVYNIDFSDITYSGIVSSIIGSIQMGIAIMVASSPLLRPIFDRTFASWFGFSLRSTRDGESGKARKSDGGTELITFGRLGTNIKFQRVNDSEEHLRAESSGRDKA